MARDRNSQQQRQNSDFNPTDFDSSWISEGFEDDTITFAEKFGKHLADNRLTTSQIRNIFGEVKRIQTLLSTQKDFDPKIKKDFLLIKPKIAYAARRAGTRGIDDLKTVMDKAHDAVSDRKYDEKNIRDRYDNFADFFEAVLAYHKASGGRD